MTLPTPRITVFERWLADRHGLHFSRYEDLWRWSVNDLNAFWRAIWDFFAIESPTRRLACSPLPTVSPTRKPSGAMM